MIRIGISGWTYEGWRGKFYPEELVQKEELEFASRQFPSIEINGTFYGLQTPKSYESWRERTPAKFVFSVKAHRFITHIKRLKDVEVPMANFFASGVLALKEKLGPILWQLPPSLKYDAEVVERFLELLPKTTDKAMRLARKHDDRVQSAGRISRLAARRLKHAMEVRHASFMVPEFFRMLRKHDVAFVFADAARKFPYAEDLTSNFVYIRLHGDAKLYVSGYTPRALKHWAERVRTWAEGGAPKDTVLASDKPGRRLKRREVYVYFDNDAKVKAPGDAKKLIELTS